MDRIKLYNDDCFNILPNLEDKSVNLFVLDLPYNQTHLKWDKDIINLEEMWKQIKRILKPNGIVIHFCNTKFGYKLIKSNEKWFKYDLVWKKSKKLGFLSSNRQPLRQHELIYIFKEKQGVYNPQKTEGLPNHPQGKGKNTATNPQDASLYGKTKGMKETTPLTTEKHPTSILNFNSVQKTIHKTQKPLDLVEFLIKTYSNENDIVCDFTFGSGTVAIASIKTNRKFIGIEKDIEIFNLAQKRIKEHL